MTHYYDTHTETPFALESLRTIPAAAPIALPTLDAARSLLPQPFWAGHQPAIDAYWKVWEIAFGNLGNPTPDNGFVSPYIDTAFNNCIFMWDSAFILLFARYGSRTFNFQGTLDNFYAKQHVDGFICREIRFTDGSDTFYRHDPGSTGPNIMPWTEWEYFLNFGDRDRLARVFPALVAYHQWTREYRTWPDGSYWSSGWGCGMDNQPRFEATPRELELKHGFLVWVDINMQQILSAKLLLNMAGVLGRESDVPDLQPEIDFLTQYVNRRLWDERSGFYYDLRRDGHLSDVKTIGAYWGLLADMVPADRLARFVGHLDDPAQFNRPHRVPSLSADHPEYADDGAYWRGGVWAPTNYMLLRGLARTGQEALAHEIALNHLDNVVRVFEETGTVWENYAPEYAGPGSPAKPDFVGWSGLPPVAVLLENVFGLRPNVPRRELVWDVRVTDAHGVDNYPFGADGQLSLRCAARRNVVEQPQIEIESNVPLTVMIRWHGGEVTRIV